MESLLQIGLIATESASGPLAACLQAGEGKDTAEAALFGQVRWLLCRPEEPGALNQLNSADAVIIGAVLRGEREVAALNSTIRAVQRAGRRILAVAVWGRQAHALAAQLNWPGALLPETGNSDQPPAAALRARVCEALRQANNKTDKQHPQPSGATTRLASANTRTSRNVGGRQVRDLSHLRQPGTTSLRTAAVPARTEAAPEPPATFTESVPEETLSEAVGTEVQSANATTGFQVSVEGNSFQAEMDALDDAEVIQLSPKPGAFDQKNLQPLPDRIEVENDVRLPVFDSQTAQARIAQLEEQLKAAEERAQFAESKSEDFFQRFARERRHAAELARDLKVASERVTELTRALEAKGPSADLLREEISKLEQLSKVVIGERDRALRERDDARLEISRLEACLTQTGVQEPAADQSPAFIRLQRQFHALESVREELAFDCERLQAELEQERALYGELETENRLLAEAKEKLQSDFQSATERLRELDSGLVEMSALAQPALPEFAVIDQPAAPKLMTQAEDFNPESMAEADLALIRRMDSVLQRLLITQDSIELLSPFGGRAASGISYETLRRLAQELYQNVKSVVEFIERLLIRENTATEQRQNMLRIMRRVVHELLRSVGTVADYSQLQTEPPTLMITPVSLAEISSDLITLAEPLIAEKRLSLSINIPPEAGQLQTDGAKLRQILASLLINATKFTPAGRISIEARAAGAQVIIGIRDTGVGIEEADQARIFDPFERIGRKTGAGLGLSVARQLAELIKGRIEVRSQPGKGSIFALILPRSIAGMNGQRAKEPKPLSEPASSNGHSSVTGEETH
jgi:signal transduction histidine kinase